MKISITGGAGFIGANLCRELLSRQGVSVSVIDDFSTGNRENLDGLDVQLINGSILDPKALDEALSGSDSVVHLAARPSVARSIDNPVETHLANATGTLSVLESVRRLGIRHVVSASSSSVYGGNPVSPKKESLAARPLSPYAASKLATEAYTLAYQRSFGLGAIAFRFFNVYGPLQPAGHAYAACIPAFICAGIRNDTLRVFGDGKQSRDFTFVGDVVRVLADAAIDKVSSEEPINLAFGGSTSLLELISMIEDIVRRPLDIEFLPERSGDVRFSQADPAQLLDLFSHIEPVALPQGLEITLEWWKRCLGAV